MSKARRTHPQHEIPEGRVGLTLQTAGGEYVATAIVPPFQRLPEVLTWGSRTFVWFADITYREACAYCVIDHTIKPPPRTTTPPLGVTPAPGEASGGSFSREEPLDG